MVADRQWIALTPVAYSKVAFEIGAPDVVAAPPGCQSILRGTGAATTLALANQTFTLEVFANSGNCRVMTPSRVICLESRSYLRRTPVTESTLD